MSQVLLVFGREGQVARALETLAPLSDFQPVFAGRERLDLAGARPDIAGLIDETAPTAVINAAAYTQVDKAESEPEACARLNRDVPIRMAEACAVRGLPFVHFSTDYVFDGEKGSPYLEADARRPLNVYGRTKAEGEAGLEALIEAGAPLALIRSSWVFSPTGANFLRTMLRLAGDRDEVGVVDDQIGCPTPADACGEAALGLARRLADGERRAAGLFHAVGADGVSWAGFAQAIFAEAARRGLPAARVRPIPTADYPTAAPRPRDTRLDSAKLQGLTGWRAPAVAEAVAACVARLAS